MRRRPPTSPTVSIFLCALAALLWLPISSVDASTGADDRGADPAEFGVLIMAHGGKPEWNEAVLQAADGMETDVPVEVAFGMASAETLQEAARKLEERGVERIGVVRLFVSGESWWERTRQILGVDPGAPPREEVQHSATGEHGNHGNSGPGGHDFTATFWRIDTQATFALSREGLSEAGEMSRVLLDRARALSEDPASESLLVLAHGPGDDAENERWIANLERLSAPLRGEFRAVEVHTLREDWPEKRKLAEERIRAFVEAAAEGEGRCLVIPFRVYGSGPYPEVLEGLEYEFDGRGLLPHEAVSDWLRQQAEALSQGPFSPTAAIDDAPTEG